MENTISKEALKENIISNLKNFSRKTIDTANEQEIYNATAYAIREIVNDKWINTQQTYEDKDVKQVYYLSMEFLMGRFFGNNLINLNVLEVVQEVFDELNIDLNLIEDQEPDPGLGNGGLGRLAACFLDSLATLGYPAYGCGIRYRYGIFEQKIIDGYQVEKPDNWLEHGNPWEIKRKEYATEIKFGGNVRAVLREDGKYRYELENYQSVMAVPYDYPVVGYDNNVVNTLRLWNAEAINKFDLQRFNAGDYHKALEEKNLAETIAEVLYPADEHYQGKELRLKQQYFFTSATVQQVINKFKQNHDDLSLLPKKVAFQLNDTHPSVAVAELMRILIDEEGLEWEAAWDITTKVCAYTNHTIMIEALETWPLELFSRLLPRIYQIIEEINRRFCIKIMDRYGNDQEKIRRMAIVADGQIRMAYLAIVGSHSVNGVARLHSEILKHDVLKEFYLLYPDKFNNKTNGITQRRWMLKANPRLSELITEKIGSEWITDLSQLKKLEEFADDEDFQKEFMDIKYESKVELAKYIKEHNGVDVDPNSIFDVQIKRLHEYKRQLLNVIHIMYLYNKIKANPAIDIHPRTFIFGAKSAAAYRKAKLIIKLINNISELINNDPDVNQKLKVVFLANYRVTLAEKIFPASDVSEQISTAGKEASGTGNMKFMLNGAVTLGTLDGANIEIKEEVGDENIFIFGMTSDQVANLYRSNSYNPWMVYNINQDIRMVLTQFINGSISSDDSELFRELYDSLLNGYGGRADEYFVLQDFDSYKLAQERVDATYRDKKKWARMAILNTANSGKFSSDRTIGQYSKEIWDLEKVDM